MATYLTGADGTRISIALCDYLDDEITDGDTVHVVHALGETASQEAIDRGRRPRH